MAEKNLGKVQADNLQAATKKARKYVPAGYDLTRVKFMNTKSLGGSIYTVYAKRQGTSSRKF